jgi:hypothetical protein
MDDSEAKSGETAAATYPPLERVTKPTLTTAEYAHYLNIKPQTARIHACKENGPIRPRRVNGRLHWPTAETKTLLGVA